ncbi:MAG TPA: carboxypeptidase-like regulatory domain-containing protein, partial [Puia sp.]|nr:carboxypeptidase-like regulatory domain-containing protein [Puia sp.]
TSKGTVTRADGTYVLAGIPGGRYELIISAIGYRTFVKDISSRSLPAVLNVGLPEKASELEAVTVEPYDKDGWKKWGKFFMDNFVGTTENASSCRFLSKKALRFHYSLKSKRLSVTATDPLIVENKALGYTLEYRMESFVADFDTHIVSYYGYPFFRDMDDSSRQREWQRNRQLAYMGSLMHFMRSLYNGRLQQDGFIIEHEIQVPNIEKQRVKAIYAPNVTKNDSIPMDTLHHYWEVLREPDYFIQKVKSYDGLITETANHAKSLFFTGDCTVIYGNGHLGIAYKESALELITGQPVVVEENGAYFPAQEVLTKGSWGETEKMANLLPRDYGMYGTLDLSRLP